jgi:glycosyltransferase 2 family protein
MTELEKRGSFRGLGVSLRLLTMLITGAVVYHLVEWKHVWRGLADLTLITVVLGVGMCVVRGVLQAWRWKWLNSDVSGVSSSWNYIVYVLSANTFNLVMPGGLGGDFVRSALIYRNAGGKKWQNVLSVWADRVLGLFSIVCIGTVVGMCAVDLPNRREYLFLVGGLWVGFVLLFGLLLCSARMSWALRRLREWGKCGQSLHAISGEISFAIRYYRQSWGNVLKALAICIPIHLCSFAVLYLVTTAMGTGLGFLQVVAVASVLWVVLAIPVSISGFGVRELTLVYLLGPYGVCASRATAISFGYFAIAVVLGMVGVPFVYLVMKRGKEKGRSREDDSM